MGFHPKLKFNITVGQLLSCVHTKIITVFPENYQLCVVMHINHMMT